MSTDVAGATDGAQRRALGGLLSTRTAMHRERDIPVVEVGGPRRHPGLRGRALLLNSALAATSLAAALGLGELLVRAVAPQSLILKRPDIWQAVDTLGWVHQPNVRSTINTGERTVRLFTDAEGFRVGAAGRVAGKKRILLLGDSFMEALQVEHEESVAGLLESSLSERLGVPVSVRNTAVGAWDPPQYLMQARRSLAREPFNLVLVALYVGNDIVEAQQDRLPPRAPAEVHPLRFPRRFSGREFVDAILYPINDVLEVRSHLFVLIKNRTQTLRMRLGLTAAYFPDPLRVEEATSRRWAVTAEICREIAALAERYDTPALFLLIPTSYQVDHDVFQDYVRGFGIDSSKVDIEQPNRMLGQALRAEKLRVIDLLPALRLAHAEGTQLYGSVDPHLSPAGNEVIARLLEPTVAEYLADRRLSQASPSRIEVHSDL